MQRKIQLNKTYITKFGTEFTPVKKEQGRVKRGYQREESRYIDSEGNRIKKSNLLKIKE